MPLSVEELLKPRYKVIALWPNCKFSIGDILTFVKEVAQTYDMWVDNNGQFHYSNIYGNYPHLFQKLHWAEERELGELPEYVKFNNQFCYKVIEWGKLGFAKCWDEINQEETTLCFIMNLTVPCTKQDYDLYQSTLAQ